jgi:hypothetical protein
MLKNRLIVLVIFIPISVFGQIDSTMFKNTIKHFEKFYIWNGQDLVEANKDVTWDSLYRSNDFNVSISKKSIHFELDQRIINNPFFTDDIADYDDNYLNYPVSNSTIYDNKLISLFRNGRFVVHNLKGYKRDTEFEDRLNTKRFSYHWVIDNKLYARDKNWIFSRLMVWDKGKWKKANISLPIKNQPILFEDKKFIIFNDCFGEWGGTVYFFDRETEDIYFTESTCTNSVYTEKGNYKVLAHLGHMIGFSELKIIEDPKKLTKAKKNQVSKTKNGEALGYSDESNGYEKSIDLYEVLLVSTFTINDRKLYLTSLNELTFLSEIQDSVIKIVHPFFDNDLYTHNPITKIYDNYTLINLDQWGTARDREVSVIIIEQNKITKLDWNERHSE